ncbi:sensor domain-containing diguanylate cyclase [Aeromonas caviae]|uniref:sensor domain-containing diguanylate cyclase n=1 Tax=Aeromonas caviae TaxID=648 RepID=UPI0015DBDAE6|nr:sensor domain-containing diguanylate cyclase [Aeromonas caviae]BBS16166.1 sensor histidine kinase [Aeromonas caviae]
MSIPSPAFARYRLQWLLLGLGLLLLLLALQHAFRQVTEINKRDTINAATQLSSQHQRMETFLEAMRGQAEERLRSNPQSVLSRQLYQALQSDGEHGINLDRIPVDLPPALIGNLTGQGPLPHDGSERQARIHLALSLSPLLATASKLLDRDVAWIYFTGTDNFIYLYPWVPSSQFRFDPVIYSKAYWQEAMARHPHLEHAMLSRPYQDFAGRGQMITLSQPITQGGQIIGLLSIDIQTVTLAQTLHRLAPRIGTLFLLNAHQQILASSQSGAAPPPVRTAQSAEYEWQQGALQLVYPIPETPLSLIHRIPLLPLLQTLLWQSATALITILCLVVATVSSLRAQRLNRRLNYLSRHDALTGAFNRHYFDAFEHRQALAGRQRIGAIMFDCDHFKQVNDRFGHGVGDQVLIRLVQLCQSLLTRECHLIRWGGEEFLLLVADEAIPLAPLAERLRLCIAEHPWSAIAAELKVTVSLGHCRQSPAISLQEVIRRADIALYQAKANGRNRSEAWRDDGQEKPE